MDSESESILPPPDSVVKALPSDGGEASDSHDLLNIILATLSQQSTAPALDSSGTHYLDADELITSLLRVLESYHEGVKAKEQLTAEEATLPQLWAAAHRISSSASAGAFGRVVKILSGPSVSSKRAVMCDELREALVAAAERVELSHDAGHVAAAIAHLVADNDEQRKPFGTVGVRVALLTLLSTATSADDVAPCFAALISITINNDNEALFGTAEIRDAIVRHAALCARSDHLAERFGNALRNLTVNVDNKVLFATDSVAAALAHVSMGCSSSASVRMVCGALSTLSTVKDRKYIGTTAIHDGLIHMARFAETQIAIRFFGNAVTNITVDDDNEKVFATTSMRDAVVALAEKSVEPLTIQWIATSLRNLAAAIEHKLLMGTPEVRSAVICLAGRANTADSVRLVCNAVHNIADSRANRTLFGVVAMREVLVAMSEFATTGDSARLLFGAFATLLIDDDNEKLFGTPSVRNVFVRLAQLCSSTVALPRWCLALRNFTTNANNKKVAGTVAMRNAIIEVMANVASTADVTAICRPVVQLTTNVAGNRKVFGCISFREALMRLGGVLVGDNKAPSQKAESNNDDALADAMRYFCNAISNITIDDDNELLYSTEEMVDLFVSRIIPRIPPGNRGPCVAAVAQSLRNLSATALNKPKFVTHEVRDAVLLLASRACDALSCQNVSSWWEKIVAVRGARSFYCNIASRDALVHLGTFARTAASVNSYCFALAQLAFDDDCENLYAHESLRDTLVGMGPFASSPDAAMRHAHCISNLTSSAANRGVFATPAVAGVLETTGGFIGTSEGVRMYAGVLYHLTLSESTRDTFVTPSLRDLMVRIAPLAATSEAIRLWSLCVFASASGATGKALYGTAGVRDVIILHSQRATTNSEVLALSKVVSTVARDDDAERVFATVTLRDAITSYWGPLIQTVDCANNVSIAFRNLGCQPEHKAIFGTAAVRDLLASLLDTTKLIGSGNTTQQQMIEVVENVCTAIRSLCEREENLPLYQELLQRLSTLHDSFERSPPVSSSAAQPVVHTAPPEALTKLLARLRLVTDAVPPPA